jgi:hypothetical protein
VSSFAPIVFLGPRHHDRTLLDVPCDQRAIPSMRIAILCLPGITPSPADAVLIAKPTELPVMPVKGGLVHFLIEGDRRLRRGSTRSPLASSAAGLPATRMAVST